MTKQEILAVAKPILFNIEMVRAILNDRKTATRRVIKQNIKAILHSQARADHPELSDKHFISKLCLAPCQPGDYLYVRETWRVQAVHRFEANARIEFKAGGPMQTIQFANGSSQSVNRMDYDAFLIKWFDFDHARWHPSIHMPKEAARLFLRVTEVRMERLQEIEHFRAEGIASESCDECYAVCGGCDPDKSPTGCDNEKEAFANLWDGTIKPAELPLYGWDANPWVRVIEFERIILEGEH